MKVGKHLVTPNACTNPGIFHGGGGGVLKETNLCYNITFYSLTVYLFSLSKEKLFQPVQMLTEDRPPYQ